MERLCFQYLSVEDTQCYETVFVMSTIPRSRETNNDEGQIDSSMPQADNILQL